MKDRRILLLLFVLVALAQLYVPAKMIWDREVIISEGTDYKFETAPVDPNDPFRGKYITLRFDENTVPIKSADKWMTGEEAYVTVVNGKDGFAKLKSASRDKPINQDYIKTKVRYTLSDDYRMMIELPFDRFYMEESKAEDAENVYTRTLRDSGKTTYALVSIKGGVAVVKDVFIDDVSIIEIVREKQEKDN
jgi:uncharacterized membrane-anchored protein